MTYAKFSGSLVLALVGLCVLVFRDDIGRVLAWLFGFLLILDGGRTMIHSFTYARRSQRKGWWVLTILSALLMIAGVVSTCLFLFMAIYPNVVYSDDAIRSMWDFVTGRGGTFFELHTVLFHGIGTFTFFLFIFQGLAKFNIKKDVLTVLITYGAYCLIVGPFAQLIDTNYNNFVHSNAPFLEDIRLKIIDGLGAVFGQTVYVLMISVGTILVPLIAYFVLKLLTGLFRVRKTNA